MKKFLDWYVALVCPTSPKPFPTPVYVCVCIYIYNLFCYIPIWNSSTVNDVYKENNQMMTGSIVLIIMLPKPIAKNVECSLTKY